MGRGSWGTTEAKGMRNDPYRRHSLFDWHDLYCDVGCEGRAERAALGGAAQLPPTAPCRTQLSIIS
jgi:hypothetical protein